MSSERVTQISDRLNFLSSNQRRKKEKIWNYSVIFGMHFMNNFELINIPCPSDMSKLSSPTLKMNYTGFDIYKFKFGMPMPVNTVKIIIGYVFIIEFVWKK